MDRAAPRAAVAQQEHERAAKCGQYAEKSDADDEFHRTVPRTPHLPRGQARRRVDLGRGVRAIRSVTSIRRHALPWVAAVVVAAVCIALGQWQTRRADEKLAIERQWAEAEAAEPLRLVDAQSIDAAAASLPRRVALQGEFLYDKTVWIGNRIVDGRPGVYAVTPLVLADGTGVVLVNRGWTPRAPGATAPADGASAPARTDSPASIVGLAVTHVPRVLELGEPASRTLGAVWPNLDYAAYEQASGLTVARFVVQQTSSADDGLVRAWPRPAAGIERHRGYALQWYALALLVVALTAYFGSSRLRRRWHGRRKGEQTP